MRKFSARMAIGYSTRFLIKARHINRTLQQLSSKVGIFGNNTYTFNRIQLVRISRIVF